MCDETTDVRNKEQAVICIRWVSKTFKVREDFMGLYELQSITSESIFKMLKDVLLRFNLPMSKTRGQSFDGASNMTGPRNGVVAKIQEIASYTTLEMLHWLWLDSLKQQQ